MKVEVLADYKAIVVFSCRFIELPCQKMIAFDFNDNMMAFKLHHNIPVKNLIVYLSSWKLSLWIQSNSKAQGDLKERTRGCLMKCFTKLQFQSTNVSNKFHNVSNKMVPVVVFVNENFYIPSWIWFLNSCLTNDFLWVPNLIVSQFDEGLILEMIKIIIKVVKAWSRLTPGLIKVVF
jgi:hypothetical protein